MFSFGEKFKELWALIPTIVNIQDYYGMANAIDDVRTGREITDRDEQVLLEVLEIFEIARRIKDREAQHE